MTPDVPASPEAVYERLTPQSHAAFDATVDYIPWAVPSGIAQLTFPYQLFIERGAGCHVWDADGRKLVDFVNGDWMFPLGHANGPVQDAIRRQLEKGSTFCLPDPGLGRTFAALLQQRVPSLERIRFTTSGTEATMFALRLARAFTGRPKIAKMIGGYHGSHDAAMVGAGHFDPLGPPPAGLVPGIGDNVVLLSFNDLEASSRAIAQHAEELAAVIVEPIMGAAGMVPGTPEFLRGLRAVTAEHGIVLIFDEVVTFPYDVGAVQGAVGVVPDLTTMGKAISGGTPLGAFGGREDIMAQVDYPKDGSLPVVRHVSTAGGAPLCLAAGLAAVEQLTPDVHRHLHALGGELRSGVNELGRKHGVPLQATGGAHFFGLQWNPEPVVDFEGARRSERATLAPVVLALNNEGYLMMTAQAGTVSAPMTSAEIEGFLGALERALEACGLV